LRHEQKLQIP